ncbi:MAG: accessory factor UbiK family protein [Alphaproteobacteria bacterium]|nr:accessory factor UbiK family protein [Alphaproteobacteria bacterium]
MQTDNPILSDLARVVSGAVGLADHLRKELRDRLRARAERALERLDLVRREEFESVKGMARKAREENEALKARLADLEGATAQGKAKGKKAA